MFPTARNSLRRWSEHYDTKIPIPIAVTLHNFLLNPPSSSSLSSVAATSSSSLEDLLLTSSAIIGSGSGGTSSFGYRVEHNRNLIPPITLEIVVHDNQVVLSETSQAVHPSWEHLDERIDLQGEWWLHYNNENNKTKNKTNNKTNGNGNGNGNGNENVYKTMKLRFRLPDGKLFLEVPMYPSQLQKLQVEETPDRLPPNACFVYFSDGSTRLPESIFQLLLDHNMTKPPPIEDFSRFGDDVFSALDSVPQKSPPGHQRNPSSLSSSSRRARSDSLLDVEKEPSSLLLLQQPSAAGSLLDAASGLSVPTGSVFEHSEQEVLQHDLNKEAMSLEEQIEQEEKAFQEELEQLNKEKESLSKMVETAKNLQSQTDRLQAEIVLQFQHVHRAKFSKDAQCIHLFRDLHQWVYPITLDSQKGFLIRNLRLPVDFKTTVVPDEELSASLGFGCHLIFLMSKYTGIGLRHKVYCNSSRSAIQQDGGTGGDGGNNGAIGQVVSIAAVSATSNNSHNLFPLFAARNVDKDQLEKGLGLLGENANCLLHTLDIDFTPQSHILKRLSLVYDHILASKHMT